MSVVRGIRIVDFDSWSSHWWNFDFHRAHHRMMAVDTPCSACGPLAIGSGDNRYRSTGFPLDHQACNVSRSMPARVLFQGVWHSSLSWTTVCTLLPNFHILDIDPRPIGISRNCEQPLPNGVLPIRPLDIAN